MKKTFFGWFLFWSMIISSAAAQDRDLAPKSMRSAYVGFHLGSPFFWGDLQSIAAKTTPGWAVGAAFGLRATTWLTPELTLDHGVGLLNATTQQGDDYFSKDGGIRYVAGDWKLGSIYGRTSFTRLGLRVPIQIRKLLRPSRIPVFDIELAPHGYLNHFRPGLYDNHTRTLLTRGTQPAPWFYSIGGDLGFQFRLNPDMSLYLRSSLTWLSDERFEGLSNDPSWRLNFQSSIMLGIQFDLGK